MVREHHLGRILCHCPRKSSNSPAQSSCERRCSPLKDNRRNPGQLGIMRWARAHNTLGPDSGVQSVAVCSEGMTLASGGLTLMAAVQDGLILIWSREDQK